MLAAAIPKVDFFSKVLFSKQWICCQIGAREHYAVPRALHQGGGLARLFTDFWAWSTIRRMGKANAFGSLASLAARFHPGVPEASVTSWNTRSALWEADRKFHLRQTGA